MKKYPRILYFIKGSVPTEMDKASALQLGTNVVFRNAVFVPKVGCLEACSGVSGLIPELYSGLPKGEDVIREFEEMEKRFANKFKQEVDEIKKTAWKANET